MGESLPATTLVIFGVSGDLSQRYLLPALAEICQDQQLTEKLQILGISRQALTTGKVLPPRAKGLAGKFDLLQLDYGSSADYAKLKARLGQHVSSQVVIYFAVPPDAVPPIIKQLGKAGLNTPKYRLLLEKPFGRDLASAQQLIDSTAECFKEKQVYRIDHYLAKEMAQNLAVFLGANAMFRDIWSAKYIEKIEILALEHIGVEGRANFYEQTGALRDIVQSHLLQLAALVLMKPCDDFSDVNVLPRRRLAALRRLRLAGEGGSATRAQYGGYGVDVGQKGSKTETFVSLTLESSDARWKNVPITLSTGKRLDQKLTEIRVYLKKVGGSRPNLLRLRLHPNEAIELDLWIKRPGYDQKLQTLPLNFVYGRHFDRLPDAYEQVIVDAIRGRANLFASSAEVLASWRILQPLLESWQRGSAKIRTYRPGSSVEEVLEKEN